jgi:hypothetical protein
MKRLLMLCCLVLSLLLIGGSLKVANAPRDMVSIVVDGKVIFNLARVEQNNSSERAKIANQLIRREISQKKSAQLEVIQGEDVAIIQIKGSNENLLIITPADVVNGENAFTQAQIWSDRLETYIHKATRNRDELNSTEITTFLKN